MALTHLQILATRYPNVPAVLAELANLEAVLTLPKPTVHVVSDVHGEDVKLRQVVNNASGSLRPLFERLFAGGTGDDTGGGPGGGPRAGPRGGARRRDGQAPTRTSHHPSTQEP